MGQAVLAAQSLAETLLTGLTTLSRTRNPASSVELTSGRTSLQTRLANHTGRTSRLASQVLAGQAQAVRARAGDLSRIGRLDLPITLGDVT